ncbi:MAG: hypothetical protein V4689_12770 [Verrucomicrobiota bacterium]
MKKNLSFSFISILLTAVCLGIPIQADPEHFDVNDVSWLFPSPSSGEELGTLISVDSLKKADGELLWPIPAFERALAIAESDDAAVPGFRIKLPDGADKMANWKIAGVRFDPSAPGASREIIDKFGSDPQIRLILQPVTGTPPRPRDVTIHLIYSYSDPEEGQVPDDTFRKAIPRKADFLEVVKDLVAVKQLSVELGATTSGQEMGVHPGLAKSASSQKVRKLMEESLVRNLSKGRLRAMAIMGLPEGRPEPWIFVAILQTADGKFVAAPGFNTPTPNERAQALSFASGEDFVLPRPISNNLAPITNKKFVPAEARRGVSTAILFSQRTDLTAKAATGGGNDQANNGEIVTNRDIVDIIGNPLRSHFFNTDCVSCHTETTRADIRKITSGGLSFKKPDTLSNLSVKVLPNGQWNVRNFGWGPGEGKPTVSRRAFNEMAESAEFINKNYVNELEAKGEGQSPEGDK